MAGLRFYILKSLDNCISLSPKPQAFRSANCYVKSVNCPDGIHLRSLYAYVNRNYQVKETKPFVNVGNTGAKVLGSKSPIVIRCYTTRPNYLFSPTSSNSLFRRAIPLVSVNPLSNYYSYTSSSGGNAGKSADSVTASFGASGVNVSDSGGENDWPEKIKDLWQSAVDAATHTGQKAKEASAELSPHVEQFLDSHPYIKNVVVPVSVTFAGTVLAWFVMPRVLRRFHKYASQGQAALLSGSMAGEEVPYEKSFWGALEDPLRYLITFMAFTQMLVVWFHVQFSPSIIF